MKNIEVGQVYYWSSNVPRQMKEVKFRFYRVLSVTLTHVYLQNMKTGYTRNLSLESFKEEYTLYLQNEN